MSRDASPVARPPAPPTRPARSGLSRLRTSRWPSPPSLVLLGTYAAIAVVQLLQSVGRTTFDTKLDLLVDPGRFLSQSITMWSPQVGMGQVQNQAYGYLFPMGPFFWLGHVLAVPAALTERIWSTVLTIAAFEGARRLALAWGGLGWRGALLVGAAFVSAPRFLTTIGALSGEVLPTAVLPWVVLPLVLARRGRRGWLGAMLLSGTALLFAGGQNATETVALLPLPAIVLVHAVVTGDLPRRSLPVWAGAVVAACAWWLGPLVLLGRYASPFLDYIESARNTTSVLGWVNSVRGADHWVAYVTVGGRPWWPAGYALATGGWLVLATAVVAALSLAGLAGRGVPDRICLTAPMLLGLACLVAAHGGWSGGLMAEQLRTLLDGALAPLRNVHKVDPLVRLPLALGFGYLAHDAREALTRVLSQAVRRVPAWLGHTGAAASVTAAACAFAVLGAAAQPAAAGELRQQPGWTSIPQPWRAAARAVDELPAVSRVLLLPAGGFGQQTWGNTVDEPLQALTTGAWVARGQAPLVPGATVRLLDSVESRLADGRGSAGLATLLTRSGVTDLLLRTDLDPDASDAPSPAVVVEALQRSPGIRLVRSFGTPPGATGPLQLWSVDPAATVPGDPAVTVPGQAAGAASGSAARDVGSDRRVSLATGSPEVVQGGPEALLPLLAAGLLPPGRPVVLAGQDGVVRRPVDLLTDTLQRREQQFGRVNEATSSVMTAQQPQRVARAASDYPAFTGQRLTVARYPGLASVSASSSGGYVDTLGPIRPEEGPYQALDSDGSTAWVSAPYTDPLSQHLTVRLRTPASLGTVPVLLWSAPGQPRVTAVTARTDVGSVTVPVDAATHVATVALPVGVTRSLTVSVAGVDSLIGSQQVGIADLHLPGVDASRTLVVPGVAAATTAMLFAATPPARTCTYPQRVCTPGAGRAAEEGAALDRTFRVGAAGTWRLSASAVASASAATTALLAPVRPGFRISGSSVLDGDPVVAPTFALDDDPLTSWVSAPDDASPRLTVSWPGERTLSRIQVGIGTQEGVRRPTVLRLHSAADDRVVQVGPGSFGFFRPLRTRHVAITFDSGRPRHRAGLSLPMEVSELTIDGAPDHYAPSPTSVTGQPCGFGPPVFVDGRRLDTRVVGTIGDVLGGTPLSVRPCGSADLTLAAGPHRLRIPSTAQFMAVQTLLVPAGAAAVRPASVRSGRPLRVIDWSATHRSVAVGAGPASVLWVRENANAGWTATMSGHVLSALTLDGWSQGWQLPAGGAGVVTLTFGPQRTYAAALVVGGASAALLLVLAVIALVRRPERPTPGPTRPPGSRPWAPTAGLFAIAVAAAFAGAGLLVGALAGLVPGLGAGWTRRFVVFVAVVVATGGQVIGGAGAGAGLLAASAVGLAVGPATWRLGRPTPAAVEGGS